MFCFVRVVLWDRWVKRDNADVYLDHLMLSAFTVNKNDPGTNLTMSLSTMNSDTVRGTALARCWASVSDAGPAQGQSCAGQLCHAHGSFSTGQSPAGTSELDLKVAPPNGPLPARFYSCMGRKSNYTTLCPTIRHAGICGYLRPRHPVQDALRRYTSSD